MREGHMPGNGMRVCNDHDVGSCETGDGHPNDVFGQVVSCGLQEGRQLPHTLVVPDTHPSPMKTPRQTRAHTLTALLTSSLCGRPSC